MIVTSSMNVLEKGLAYAANKQEAISSNIANIDTPNYKAKTIDFQSVLQAVQEEGEHLQAKRTNESHLPFPGTSFPESSHHSRQRAYAHNGNSVDIDKEMTEMAENQLYYQALTDRMSSSVQSLEMVIRGSK
ncbi:flagellar basal body rod protein FlgB [Shouchella shacheensis]|uniref:flagellar basal body rod protein FlgB n=1 Tax=Shouchella shacheensis TaxID=1649580 RepID=UPI0007402002|nr:flagellar basal body rod protein FlgB [Shouchella shacheensis]